MKLVVSFWNLPSQEAVKVVSISKFEKEKFLPGRSTNGLSKHWADIYYFPSYEN